MNYNYLEVQFKDIYDSGLYDLHPFLKDDYLSDELTNSFVFSSILNPPVLLNNENETYDIICGRKRLKFLRDLPSIQGASHMCRILPSSTPTELILRVLIEDQYQSKGLTLVEQACFIDLCRKLLTKDDDVGAFMNSFPKGRITKGLKFLNQFLKIDDSLQRDIHNGYVSEKIIAELLRFTTNEQALLADLIKQLDLGINKQRKFVTDIFEVTTRADLTLKSFLELKDIQEILGKKELSGQQKTAKIFGYLNKTINPQLSTATELFKKEIAQLQLPTNCSLATPAAFEKDEISLTIRYSNLEALKHSWGKIRKHIN